MSIALAVASAIAGGAPSAPAQRLVQGQIAIWLEGDSLTQSGGIVTGWVDKAGLNAPAVPTNSPVYTAANANFNGHSTASFLAATVNKMTVLGLTVPQPDTVYIVGRSSDTTHGQCFIDCATTRQFVGLTSIDQLQLFAGTGTIQAGALGTSAAVIACVFAGVGSAGYKNNSQTPIVTGSPGAATLTGLQFGGSPNVSTLTGDIAAIIITNVSDSAAQRLAMFQYLGAKYGVVVS